MKHPAADVDVEVEDVGVDMVVAVELVVSTVTISVMRTHLLPLLVMVLLKETPGSRQKGLVMVDSEVLIEGVGGVVEASAMEKVVKMGIQEEHLNDTVGLAAEVNSNAKVLGEEIGEIKLKNMPRRLRKRMKLERI